MFASIFICKNNSLSLCQDCYNHVPSYSILISKGLSSSSETYFPFFFLWRTHSERRYSICPLTERKSSSAQAAISPYSFAERRRGICFFCVSAIINTGFRNSQPAVRHGFRTGLPGDWIPLPPFVPHPTPPYASHLNAPGPSLPCLLLHPQSSYGHL